MRILEYELEIMTQEQAEIIAFNWHYEGEYSFYDIEADKEDLDEFLNPEKRGDTTFVVTKEKELFGFFSFNEVNQNTIEMGLGMRPDLTGRGVGEQFVRAGIEFAKSKYKPNKITLSVASFNQRAIKVYQKIGFEEVAIFMQDTNGSNFEFLKMSYRCS